ncbi:MAG: hypothetical protein KA533_04450 [Sphingobium sp.]|nr:hypothetical protein [Sphingobium sp.]MBP6111210.1 hypothetical protein [Sphingobium sp.]MBP8670246.1 hypothetical protein [Sphingobium sp.]MBP9156184.1 hypothetical protein [Sphingobium sp.]MCC6481305.1 hypothetical protein [Sphingomonadaceae bacterium]
MFDKLLENLNLDEIAGKLGLPADQIKSLTESLTANLGEGGDTMAALMQTAERHGLPVDKLQEMLGNLGGNGADDLLGKVGGLLGSEGGLGGLADAAKGMFGKN